MKKLLYLVLILWAPNIVPSSQDTESILRERAFTKFERLKTKWGSNLSKTSFTLCFFDHGQEDTCLSELKKTLLNDSICDQEKVNDMAEATIEDLKKLTRNPQCFGANCFNINKNGDEKVSLFSFIGIKKTKPETMEYFFNHEMRHAKQFLQDAALTQTISESLYPKDNDEKSILAARIIAQSLRVAVFLNFYKELNEKNMELSLDAWKDFNTDYKAGFNALCADKVKYPTPESIEEPLNKLKTIISQKPEGFYTEQDYKEIKEEVDNIQKSQEHFDKIMDLQKYTVQLIQNIKQLKQFPGEQDQFEVSMQKPLEHEADLYAIKHVTNKEYCSALADAVKKLEDIAESAQSMAIYQLENTGIAMPENVLKHLERLSKEQRLEIIKQGNASTAYLPTPLLLKLCMEQAEKNSTHASRQE